jgi:hypothetical protein
MLRASNRENFLCCLQTNFKDFYSGVVFLFRACYSQTTAAADLILSLSLPVLQYLRRSPILPRRPEAFLAGVAGRDRLRGGGGAAPSMYSLVVVWGFSPVVYGVLPLGDRRIPRPRSGGRWSSSVSLSRRRLRRWGELSSPSIRPASL